MNTSDLITVDPGVLGGTPVFKGPRVPVKTLFEDLGDDCTLEEFLECSILELSTNKWRRIEAAAGLVRSAIQETQPGENRRPEIP